MKKGIENANMGSMPTQMFQPILCKYEVNAQGTMTKRCEIDVKMGRKLIKPHNGNMSLTRSRDRKTITLTNFEKNNDSGQYFKVFAWNATNLKAFEITEEFHKAINRYYDNNKDIFGDVI